MVVNKAFKYRLYPTKEQEELLAKHFGCKRFVYNKFLGKRIEEYKNNKKSLNYYACAKELTKLKEEEIFSWLNEVNSQMLQAALKDLDGAYGNFFKRHAQFPTFKSRNSRQSFKIPQFIKIENGKIFFPKFKEGIKLTVHRPYGKICYATISKSTAGRYYVSLTCEVEVEEKKKLKKTVGIDLGLKDFLVTSDNLKISNPKFYRKNEKKIKFLSRKISKRKKDSNRRQDARIKLAKVHEFIKDSRSNFLHQLSSKLINENQVICLEDLNVKGMTKNHQLAKSVHDVSWSEFVRQLEYKALWYGRQVVKIDRFFPSSKTCNHCGFVNQTLTLNDRTWICKGCGEHLDRDYNASLNILQQGLNDLKMSGLGTNSDSKQKLVEPTKKFVYRNLSKDALVATKRETLRPSDVG